MATSVNNCSVKISKRAILNEKRAHFLDFYKSEGAPCPSAPPIPRPMTGCRAKSKFQVDFPLKKYFMHKNIKCKTIIKEHYSVKKQKNYRAMPYRGRLLTICAPLQLSRLWHSKEDQVVLEYQVEI